MVICLLSFMRILYSIAPICHHVLLLHKWFDWSNDYCTKNIKQSSFLYFAYVRLYINCWRFYPITNWITFRACQHTTQSYCHIRNTVVTTGGLNWSTFAIKEICLKTGGATTSILRLPIESDRLRLLKQGASARNDYRQLKRDYAFTYPLMKKWEN